jgi:uncharacterized protein YPO0396
MLSLFSTSSERAGFRLQSMEVYNWGTFHDRVFKINPQGNNSLLTGANASGKSTFIDALLTLLVPIKKDRFYNQSSGGEKKGDRTEETYVFGHYGNIQKEGELGTTTQSLRDKSVYSVLLATFSNTDERVITLFQARWFSNGELKRTYGIAHVALEIEKDFSQFDNKGNWRKNLDKIYNSNSSKKRVEFLDGPTSYAERIAHLFGMRSTKALSLFNQVVGVKVLEDLDEFIRNNMLEELDAESEFIQLKESFITLMDAKTNIEKAKEQIAQLAPINDLAVKIKELEERLIKEQKSKELAVYWFAEKGVELSSDELTKCKDQLIQLSSQLELLREKERELKGQETDLMVQIKSDEVGSQIERLKSEIGRLESSREIKKSKLEDYNGIAKAIEFTINPDEDTFKISRELSRQKRNESELKRQEAEESLRQSKNKQDKIKEEIQQNIESITILNKNKNNISGREAEIRDNILEYVGATKEEIPFIGELIKVTENQKVWELAIEKVLHNFALRLVVPEKYYSKVNEYVNKTNLRGRIIYQRYKGFTSLGKMSNDIISDNSLVTKLDFKPRNPYKDWLEDVISKQYNYSCVTDLSEFNLYEEKALTIEGLIKFAKGKHEKDDRPHITRRENFVLGWDNKEKIQLIKAEIASQQENQKGILLTIRTIEDSIKKIDEQKEAYSDLFKQFTKYEEINWQVLALEIQEKEVAKAALEKTNDRVKELQGQLSEVQRKLKSLTDDTIQIQNRKIFEAESKIKLVDSTITKNKNLLKQLGAIDTSALIELHPELENITYHDLPSKHETFQSANQKKIELLEGDIRINENEVRIKINGFKQPDETITAKFKDWRSDVSRLPESTHLEFISEYQSYYKDLVGDNLPKYEKRFNEYLQETLTNKVGDFRMFFENWSDSIKENIRLLNESLHEIDFKNAPLTYIQLIAGKKINTDVDDFRNLLYNAIPNFKEVDASIDGRKNHFYMHIEPLILKLEKEDWRKKVMDVRSWYTYKAEEFYKETNQKFTTYENMGQLSGGEKAQLTYTILGSAIAYQFGLTKDGLQSNSFRFIAIDEAFKAQDEDKARYLITLCKQLHLQLLVVTPSDNIHIVEQDISFVHFVERKDAKHSWLYDMPIEQFQLERQNFISA